MGRAESLCVAPGREGVSGGTERTGVSGPNDKAGDEQRNARECTRRDCASAARDHRPAPRLVPRSLGCFGLCSAVWHLAQYTATVLL